VRVLGYTWAGVRTADLKLAARFFAEALGPSLIHEGEGWFSLSCLRGSC
jgi:hypothetical protein